MKNPRIICQKIRKKFLKNLLISLYHVAPDMALHRAVYVTNQKGGQNLKDVNGMIYTRNKRRNKKAYYICKEKNSLKCTATAIVDQESQLVKLVGEHVHDSNLLKQDVKKMEDEAIKAAGQNRSVPRSVLGNLCANIATTTKGNILFFIGNTNKPEIRISFKDIHT